MKLSDALKFCTGTFEYDTAEGSVQVVYDFFLGDPEFGERDDYEIRIFDGEDDISWKIENIEYLEIERKVIQHYKDLLKNSEP